MKLSIALCTYNGERYLHEQLESYLAQTRLPDELIVCDDGSTDDTVAILEAFAAQAPFFVQIYRNEQNLGVAKNFEKAISLCTGDVIAISDQDDIWLTTKLESFLGIFERNPSIGLVFSDADIIDAESRPKPQSLWRYVHFSRAYQRQIKAGVGRYVLIRGGFVWGMTMVFHARYKSLILPIIDASGYDFWISTLISLVGEYTIIPQKLVKHRLHGGNASIKEMGNKSALSTALNAANAEGGRRIREGMRSWRYELYAERLREQPNAADYNESIRLLEKKLAFIQRRKRFPRKRLMRLPHAFYELMMFNYHRYAMGFRDLAKDIIAGG